MLATTEIARTTTTPGVSQARVRTALSPVSASSMALRIGGLTSQISTAPATEPIWQMNRAIGVGSEVAARTPRTGPTMKVSSVATASIDSAEVRWAGGVLAISTVRTIEKLGTVNSPATATHASSGQ